ncbi:neprilysin isoform X2 [Lingula anatina]|uniref:Neprilysin isoform X2 n=1 Tax=Lingula anatina TaxID=7574 RepID=A0A2R2MJ28_LINAN|nr:neprilysin isoform X2 [Lingula anatina]|eukprot:XP_023930213.1 neprilysin isoform X2 [Lingula anatina]
MSSSDNIMTKGQIALRSVNGVPSNGAYVNDMNLGTSSSQVEILGNEGTIYKKGPRKERILLAVSMALLVGCIVVLVLFLTGVVNPAPLGQSSPVTEKDVCLDPECVRTAANLLNGMDQTIDPCDDFFEYACGAWNRKNIIPEDKSSYNTFGKLRDELQVLLKALLEKPDMPNQPNSVTKTRNLYRSCMNESLIELRGAKPVFDFLETLGGWPVLTSNWSESSFDWIELVAKLRLYNNKLLIDEWVSSDDKNSSVNIIQLDQVDLGMPSRDYFLKGRDEKVEAYENFAVSLAILMGANETVAREEMREMVEFETKLANSTTPPEDRRDNEKLYNRFTIRELYTNITDKIDWLKFLNILFQSVNITLTEDEELVVYAPEYFGKLVDVLHETSNRTIANYLVWRIMMNRVGNLPKRFQSLNQAYSKVLYGTDTDQARWRKCVSYATDNMGMAVGRLFVEEHFNSESKESALAMIANIRDAFNELLMENDWMDTETRKVAREKAAAMEEKIGFPAYILNNTALDDEYTTIDYQADKYFENVLANIRHIAHQNFKKLREPVDKTSWSTYPPVVNAFYSATKNQIMFPAGILQPPFYSKTFPKSLNYGGIGMVIGHEITHGFDDRGRQFDKDGNLVQWWDQTVVDNFKKKTLCIIQQYGNYTVKEVNMNLNGIQTQGENIADNGGLKQAFRAYRKWVAKQGKEESKLPGISLNHNQLFFLNFAQMWCGTDRHQRLFQKVLAGAHSINRFRVIGTLSNSEDFSNAYNCKPGSKMNPVNKCAVW